MDTAAVLKTKLDHIQIRKLSFQYSISNAMQYKCHMYAFWLLLFFAFCSIVCYFMIYAAQGSILVNATCLGFVFLSRVLFETLKKLFCEHMAIHIELRLKSELNYTSFLHPTSTKSDFVFFFFTLPLKNSTAVSP